MSKLLERAISRVRALPEERQEELAEIMLDLAENQSNWEPSSSERAEIELAQRETREGDFASDQEMAELWRHLAR
ncbi:MAG: hypothetical protein JO261_00590 [Alphaproteobacteria bacterium]|nr:hypothetical protein [Alphaproteobacteria bacterium]MBV9692172.1 hypothetical protein [Alphaproteobacteria bacterium]